MGHVLSNSPQSPPLPLGSPAFVTGLALWLFLWWRAEESEIFLVPMSLSKVAQPKREREGPVFRKKWERDYFFVEVKNMPTCLICKKIMSVFKEYNLKRHYESKHSKSFDQYTEQTRDAVLSELKKGLKCQ